MATKKRTAETGSDGLPIVRVENAGAFRRLLEREHTESKGFWLAIPKKGSGLDGPTYAEAVDEALCFGWIDGQKARLDEREYLQRFTPRRARSIWSKVNRKKIEALVAAGRMEPAGMARR